MPSIFDRLRAALKRKDSPATELEAAVSAAADVLAKAEARLAALEAKRRQLLAADDATRAAHRLELQAARQDVEDARAYRAELGERHAAAVAEEERAAALARYRAAEAQRDQVAREIATEYPGLSARMAQLIRLSAEADLVVAAANAALPADAPPLFTAEATVRDWPTLRREELPPVTREAWAFKSDGALVPEGRWDEIQPDRGGHVFPSPVGALREVVKVTVRDVRWLPDEGAKPGARLAELRLPGLRFGEADAHDGTHGDPAATLARLDALSAAKPASRTPRQTETWTESIPSPGDGEIGPKAA